MDPDSKAMKNSSRFKQHAGYMIQMLDRALSLLGPDAKTLAAVLDELGKKHVRLGVKESFFPFMGEALIETMRAILGPKFIPELEQSWKEVYNVLSTAMIRAMNNEQEVLRSWGKLKKVENYEEVAGTLIFRRYAIVFIVQHSFLLGKIKSSLNLFSKITAGSLRNALKAKHCLASLLIWM